MCKQAPKIISCQKTTLLSGQAGAALELGGFCYKWCTCDGQRHAFLLSHNCRGEAKCVEIVLLLSFTQGTSEHLGKCHIGQGGSEHAQREAGLRKESWQDVELNGFA